MNDIGNLLKQTLDDQASRVVDPDPAARARLVIDQANPAGRRGPRLVALGITAAVLAGGAFVATEVLPKEETAVPDPMGAVTASAPSSPLPTATATGSASSSPSASSAPSQESSPQPAPSSAAIPTPSFPVGTSASAALAKLPTGAAAQLPWQVTGSTGEKQLKLPGLTVPLPKGAADVGQLLPTTDGWFVRTMSDGFTGGGPDTKAQILRVGRDGEVRTFAEPGLNSAMALSPDGKRLAWIHVDGGAAVLHVAPVDTSEQSDVALTGAENAAVADSMTVTAWTSSGIFVEGMRQDSETDGLWIADPRTGRLTTAKTLATIVQLAPGRTIQISRQGEQECASLVQAGAADRRMLCAAGIRVETDLAGASGSAWLESVPADGGSDAVNRPGVLVTDSQVIEAVRPGWLGMNGWRREAERPASALVQLYEPDDKQTLWVRWDLAAGTAEKIAPPS